MIERGLWPYLIGTGLIAAAATGYLITAATTVQGWLDDAGTPDCRDPNVCSPDALAALVRRRRDDTPAERVTVVAPMLFAAVCLVALVAGGAPDGGFAGDYALGDGVGWVVAAGVMIGLTVSVRRGVAARTA
ncbi:hypothetical protein [Actinoplanes rectilineatus]|uniref:hypothetical protein n=1 Tax=Actinoplanes rectilineatus TaxID=113571 RepID=UPI0005F28F9D|nr:hypothetical protein [Actinoplanes rectilineatus]